MFLRNSPRHKSQIQNGLLQNHQTQTEKLSSQFDGCLNSASSEEDNQPEQSENAKPKTFYKRRGSSARRYIIKVDRASQVNKKLVNSIVHEQSSDDVGMEQYIVPNTAMPELGPPKALILDTSLMTEQLKLIPPQEKPTSIMTLSCFTRPGSLTSRYIYERPFCPSGDPTRKTLTEQIKRKKKLRRQAIREDQADELQPQNSVPPLRQSDSSYQAAPLSPPETKMCVSALNLKGREVSGLELKTHPNFRELYDSELMLTGQEKVEIESTRKALNSLCDQTQQQRPTDRQLRLQIQRAVTSDENEVAAREYMEDYKAEVAHRQGLLRNRLFSQPPPSPDGQAKGYRQVEFCDQEVQVSLSSADSHSASSSNFSFQKQQAKDAKKKKANKKGKQDLDTQLGKKAKTPEQLHEIATRHRKGRPLFMYGQEQW